MLKMPAGTTVLSVPCSCGERVRVDITERNTLEIASLKARLAVMEKALREWQRWYRETKPYRIRIQLEAITDAALEAIGKEGV